VISRHVNTSPTGHDEIIYLFLGMTTYIKLKIDIYYFAKNKVGFGNINYEFK